MATITPFLWFDGQAEEAAVFYTSIFEGSKVGQKSYYGPSGPLPRGTVMVVEFQLEGQSFTALNGGPDFHFTPAISFYVRCGTVDTIDALWRKLSDGGTVLMELQRYPFSERFGWVGDRYGVTWQLNLEPMTPGPQPRRAALPQRIVPFLLFVGKQQGRAEEAMNRYTSIFPGSKVELIQRHPAGGAEPEGSVQHARFLLDGQEFMAMDSALQHEFTFTPALSLYVRCQTQAEIDAFWSKLCDGGAEVQCGWLTDRFGVSWQIVPSILAELVGDNTTARSHRVMDAVMKMVKLDIEELRKAHRG
ncbi:MAG TPA: VOC family protein [Spirochaetia bacterium]|nr:VOC family protein [Spirochaetia bacterium]